MLLLCVFLLISLVSSDLLDSFRSDGFSENVVSKAFPAQVSIHIHAAKRASDGSIVAAGTVLYPSGYIPNGEIIDGPGIIIPDQVSKERLSAFVTRIRPNREVAWAIRTAPTKSGKTVSLALDDSDNIFIAGLTTGVLEKGVSSGEAPFLAKFDKNGESPVLVTHGNAGMYYTSVAWRKTAPNELILVSYATGSHAVFSGVENTPTKSGLVAVKVNAGTLSIMLLNPISITENPSKADLVQDKFWDLEVSSEEDLVYIAIKRQVVANWVHSFTPYILAISATNFASTVSKPLPKDLQLSMKLSKGSNSVYASYVSRTNNREQVVIRKFNPTLDEDNWKNSETSVFELPIAPDAKYFRKVASSVVDFTIAEDMTVIVLLHASEILDRNDPDLEEHRQLSNGRPAVVVISAEAVLSHVTQSTGAENWQPVNLLLGESANVVIVGTDSGDGYSPTTNPRPLLTGLQRQAAIPQISPRHSPGVPEASPGRSDGANQECIGMSSSIDGHLIIEHVGAREDLRLQVHPLRKLSNWLKGPEFVQMLCMEWKNGTTESSLCATPFHVVRWHGDLMYMNELCERSRSCLTRMDEPFSFKGACEFEGRNEVVAHKFLAVTMHSASNGGISAQNLAEAECSAMKTTPFQWLLSTL